FHDGARVNVGTLGDDLVLFVEQPRVDGDAVAIAAGAIERNGKTLQGVGRELDGNGARLAVAELPAADFHDGVEAGAVILDFAGDGEPGSFGHAAVRQAQPM